MTCLLLNFSPIGGLPTLLTWPQPLTPQGLLKIEQSVAGTLGILRRDLLSAGLESMPAEALRTSKRSRSSTGPGCQIAARSNSTPGQSICTPVACCE